jgi:type I restriction enzyme M protein
LHSQLTVKAIESLRFASGDEEIRAAIYDEFGDVLFRDFGSMRPQLESWLDDYGKTDDEEDEEESKGLPDRKKKKLLDAKTWERDGRLVQTADALRNEIGGDLFEDHNVFRAAVGKTLDKLDLKLSAADIKVLLRAVSWRVDTAPAVIAKTYKPGKKEADPLHGLFQATIDSKEFVVEYEPDSDLRDTEQVPLLEPGGVEAFIQREVLPYTPDAWIDESATKLGYEISFTRHFYKPQPLRTLEEIRAEIQALEAETGGLLEEIMSANADG